MNKKKYFLITLIILAFFIGGCNKKSEKTEVVEINKTIDFKAIKQHEDNFISSYPVQVVVYQDNIYVLDKKLYKVLVYDKNGFVRAISRAGQGPGELFTPRGLCVNKYGIFIYNSPNRIEHFDLNGKLIDSVRIDKSNNPIGPRGFSWGIVGDKDNFYLIPYNHDVCINILDKQGKKVGTYFDQNLRYPDPKLCIEYSLFYINNFFVAINLTSGKISIINKEKKLTEIDNYSPKIQAIYKELEEHSQKQKKEKNHFITVNLTQCIQSNDKIFIKEATKPKEKSPFTCYELSFKDKKQVITKYIIKGKNDKEIIHAFKLQDKWCAITQDFELLIEK